MAATGRPPDTPGRTSFGGLVIDHSARLVTLDGSPLQLTRSEFEVLTRLTQTPGGVVTSADLLSYVWDEPWSGDETSIETHISRLRRKLGESASAPRFIWTIRGVGYRFQPGDPAQDLTEPTPESDHRGQGTRKGRRRLLIAALALMFIGLLGFAAIAYLNPPNTTGECAAGYEPCLPVTADLDCAQIRQQVTVTGSDPYGLDRDGDGLGCQLYGPPQ